MAGSVLWACSFAMAGKPEGSYYLLSHCDYAITVPTSKDLVQGTLTRLDRWLAHIFSQLWLIRTLHLIPVEISRVDVLNDLESESDHVDA